MHFYASTPFQIFYISIYLEGDPLEINDMIFKHDCDEDICTRILF